ncbi:AMP-binding protein, partial [Streptomyces sp. MCAF7]
MTQLLVRAAVEYPYSGVGYLPDGAEGESIRQPYSELLDSALRLLTGLRSRGLRAGDKVALLLDDQREFLSVFWACLLGGFVPCPMAPVPGDPARWAAQLAHVDRLLDRPLLVTTEATRAELPNVPGLAVAPVEGLGGGEPAPDIHRAAPEDLALLVLTSGSTGNSKAVMLSHGNLLASMAGKSDKQQLTAADTTFNWISYDHVAALLEAHLLPLYAGANQLHAPASVILEEPQRFLRIISR